MPCCTDRLSLMAGTYGRVYLCLSTFGTDKVHSLSLVWFVHPKVGHGSSASEPMGPSRGLEYTLLGVHAGRGSSTILGSVLGLEYRGWCNVCYETVQLCSTKHERGIDPYHGGSCLSQSVGSPILR